MAKESKFDPWSKREKLYKEINRKREVTKNKNQETLEGSIFDCFLIEQKVKEWQGILKKTKDDPVIKRKQLKDIQGKLQKICDIIFHTHGRSKYADALVSKIYYNYFNKIKTVEKYFNDTKIRHEEKISEFIKSSVTKQLIEGLPFDEDFDLE